MTAFAPLLQELDRWAERGEQARFWLRDDDAVTVTPALERLLSLSVPMTLAVIPARAEASLAMHLADEPGVEVAVHGWSHVNHAAAGAKSAELGADRPAAQVLAELAVSLDWLEGLFGEKALRALVPPWNRIAPAVVAGLPDLGFTVLSVFGPEAAGQPKRINTHVDLIDWRGSRGGRPVELLVSELVARLKLIEGRAGHVGLLSHHLVHDTAAWAFLEGLMAATRAHRGCEWVGLRRLLTA
ncbi:MAG: polysaccharide deacetylase family protein [Paracoccaceae bacterium]